jgi:hypothetical protein
VDVIDIGICEPSAPASAAALTALRTRMGDVRPKWVVSYRFWNDTLDPADFTNAAAAGCGVIVTLEPWTAAHAAISLTSISSGGQDATLATFAAWMAAAPCPVILRFAHEMNGAWYPWGTANSAADYIAAYRYVTTYMRAHAPAVKHFWCPNVNPPDAPTIPFTAQYPGAAYCDYVGLDGYNWVAVKGAPWQSLDTVMGSSYDVLTALAPGRPVVIGETSCNPVGGDKALWIAQAWLTTIPTRMPAVVIACWFNYDKSGAGEADWRFDSSSDPQTAFARVARDPRYGGSLPVRRFSRAGMAGAIG